METFRARRKIYRLLMYFSTKKWLRQQNNGLHGVSNGCEMVICPLIPISTSVGLSRNRKPRLANIRREIVEAQRPSPLTPTRDGMRSFGALCTAAVSKCRTSSLFSAWYSAVALTWLQSSHSSRESFHFSSNSPASFCQASRLPSKDVKTEECLAPSKSDIKKVYYETYGCQMNVNDLEIVLSILAEAGYRGRALNPEAADVILINTCAIRENAENKIWHRLNYFKHMKQRWRTSADTSVSASQYSRTSPPKVAVLGCMAERLKTKLLDANKLVDVVCGPDAYRDLPRLLSEVEDSGQAGMNTILSLEETYADVSPIRVAPNSVTAFVSVMRGCDNMCAFCVVPFTRGRERSRPGASILRECGELWEQGVREVTLLGQNVNSYRDLSSESDLASEERATPTSNRSPGSVSQIHNDPAWSVQNLTKETAAQGPPQELSTFSDNAQDEGTMKSGETAGGPRAFEQTSDGIAETCVRVFFVPSDSSPTSKNTAYKPKIVQPRNQSSSFDSHAYRGSTEEPGYHPPPQLGASEQHQISAISSTLSSGFSTIYRPKVGGTRFAHLLSLLSESYPEMRFRFTSPHPKDFPDDLLFLLRDRPNLCPSLHLPAQSGSSSVLQRMRRGYTREAYLALVQKVRAIVPDVAISSDFITGFCGETEEEHQDSLTLIQEVGYDMAYMFAYSMREKTHAHRRYVDDVPEDVKKRRLSEMIDTFRNSTKHNYDRQVGTMQLVLVEGPNKRAPDAELVGKTAAGHRVIFPQQPIQGWTSGASSAKHMQGRVTSQVRAPGEDCGGLHGAIPRAGDFVEVEIGSSTHASLKGQAWKFSSISEFASKRKSNGKEALAA
eukprot:TRINITY_DN17090_c0_g1_i1.p1 TRINITY_DN17090_c0_g1~~TRINITY_DN17090_c0_g1_i1.p1  ORF type:complete len:839 (-),score=74.24 TRINITY_DN17090_c0_g1_i1:971-3487(-)